MRPWPASARHARSGLRRCGPRSAPGGWHLEEEPDLTPAAPDELQEFCLILCAEAQLRRDTAATAGQDTSDYDQLIGELDIEITRAGIRGTVTTRHGSGDRTQPVHSGIEAQREFVRCSERLKRLDHYKGIKSEG